MACVVTGHYRSGAIRKCRSEPPYIAVGSDPLIAPPCAAPPFFPVVAADHCGHSPTGASRYGLCGHRPLQKWCDSEVPQRAAVYRRRERTRSVTKYPQIASPAQPQICRAARPCAVGGGVPDAPPCATPPIPAETQESERAALPCRATPKECVCFFATRLRFKRKYLLSEQKPTSPPPQFLPGHAQHNKAHVQ